MTRNQVLVIVILVCLAGITGALVYAVGQMLWALSETDPIWGWLDVAAPDGATAEVDDAVGSDLDRWLASLDP